MTPPRCSIQGLGLERLASLAEEGEPTITVRGDGGGPVTGTRSIVTA